MPLFGGPDSAEGNPAGEVDLLWDAEVCPEGTAIIHRSTQGPSMLRLETVQPAVRTWCQGLFSALAFGITFLYLTMTVSLLFLVAPVFYGGLAPGAGFLLIMWIEMPLIIGAYVPLAIDMFSRYIEPLITKEILELDPDTYTYSRELHPKWLQVFRRRYVPLASGGDTSELASVELLAPPHGGATSLFLAAGFEFGFNVGQRDAEMLRDVIRTHLRSVGVQVQEVPPPNRPPHNPCYQLSMTEGGGVSATFGVRDSVLRWVGYLSLWTLPLSLVVPLLPFVGYNTRPHYDHDHTEGMVHPPPPPNMDDDDFDSTRGGGDDDFAPGVVWAGFHSALYLWWSFEYLTRLTVAVDKVTGLTARRTLTVFPCLRLPFPIFDGWLPTFRFFRPLCDITDVDFKDYPAGSTLCLNLLPRTLRSKALVLPLLSYHELVYLQWIIKDAMAPGSTPHPDDLGGGAAMSTITPVLRPLYTLEDGHHAPPPGTADVELGFLPGQKAPPLGGTERFTMAPTPPGLAGSDRRAAAAAADAAARGGNGGGTLRTGGGAAQQPAGQSYASAAAGASSADGGGGSWATRPASRPARAAVPAAPPAPSAVAAAAAADAMLDHLDAEAAGAEPLVGSGSWQPASHGGRAARAAVPEAAPVLDFSLEDEEEAAEGHDRLLGAGQRVAGAGGLSAGAGQQGAGGQRKAGEEGERGHLMAGGPPGGPE